MATYTTDLATAQAAALLDSAQLNSSGELLTGKVKMATARVEIAGGITAATHTIEGLLLPPGARVIPHLCGFVVDNETGMDYTATIKYRESDENILQTSITTGTRSPNSPYAIDAEFTAPQSVGRWIDVGVVEANGTANDLVIDLYVAYQTVS